MQTNQLRGGWASEASNYKTGGKAFGFFVMNLREIIVNIMKSTTINTALDRDIMRTDIMVMHNEFAQRTKGSLEGLESTQCKRWPKRHRFLWLAL